jgi:antitoxin FitA
MMETAIALRLGMLYAASVEAGASQGVAKEASEEVAKYDRDMHGIERKLTRLEACNGSRARASSPSSCASIGREAKPMPQPLGRNLEDAVEARLRLRARRHGRSIEEEVRQIIRNAVKNEIAPRKPLGSRLRERFGGIGLEEDLPELRGEGSPPGVFQARCRRRV